MPAVETLHVFRDLSEPLSRKNYWTRNNAIRSGGDVCLQRRAIFSACLEPAFDNDDFGNPLNTVERASGLHAMLAACIGRHHPCTFFSTHQSKDQDMPCSLQRSTPQPDQGLAGLLNQRSRPHVLIFDEEANIAFADADALALFQEHFCSVEHEVVDMIRSRAHSDAMSEQLFGPIAGRLLRIVPLKGPRAMRFYAAFLENEARREDLKDAVTRFSFTPREVEVLNCILNGMSAAEIAEDLCIAQVTVFDHFKHISHKTKARNRADMLAKIFNWQPAAKSKTLDEYGDDRRPV